MSPLEKMLMQIYGPRLEEQKRRGDWLETPNLKMHSPQDVNERLDGILLIAKPHVNGEVLLTAEVITGYSDATRVIRRPVTTVQINPSLITNKETSTVFAMPVTIAGTPLTINITIGPLPKSSLISRVLKRKRRKS